MAPAKSNEFSSGMPVANSNNRELGNVKPQATMEFDKQIGGAERTGSSIGSIRSDMIQ